MTASVVLPPADLHAALTQLLTAPPQADTVEHVDDWVPRWRACLHSGAAPFVLALRGGFAADRAGWAFAAGYQAALRAHLGPLPQPAALLSLCVTEPGGNRPRDIATRRDADGRLTGHKRWSTLAPVADRLLVIANEAAAGERACLAAVWVARGAPGLTMRTMPATPFAPEVPHAELTLDGVATAADDRVDGDAYERIVRPFRTVEDLYVATALLAWLLREARHQGWPAAYVDRCLAVLLALAAASTLPADAPATHLALDGALAAAAVLHDEADTLWAARPGAAQARFQRDRGLSGVAAAARAQRTLKARERLQQPPLSPGW